MTGLYLFMWWYLSDGDCANDYATHVVGAVRAVLVLAFGGC